MKVTITINKVKESRRDSVDFSNLPFGKVMTDHMFIADYKDGEWQNARIVPLDNLQIHPANMALHYGQSIFEGMKAGVSEDGTPLLFRPELHAERINASARRMCMPEIPHELFLEAVKQITWIEKDWIPKTEGSALYLRPFMFATDNFIGVAPSQSFSFIIITLPVGPYYAKPVKLYADEQFVRASKGGTGEAKAAGNYAGSLLPAQLARAKGFDQVLWLDARYRKFVQEVGTMNIFFVLKDRVITPLTDGAILKGITRLSIIDLLKERGILVEERPITIDEIIDAYDKKELLEVFGSGTAAVVSNVSVIAYKDKTMTFEDTAFDLSLQMKAEINSIRNGSIPDNHGWIVPIEQPELIA